MLATFWQGRLIPATRIESLPFIEATRLKRSAAARDILPDEVFSRLRSAPANATFTGRISSAHSRAEYL